MDDQRTDREADICGRKYFVPVIAAISILALGTHLVWPVEKPEAPFERHMRYLLTRDLLARHLQNLNIDIKRKLDEYLDIARESPSPKAYDIEFEQFDSTQLMHEINRLQELTAAESDPERIGELRGRQQQMMNEVKTRIEGGRSMFYRHRDLEQLQQIAHDIAVKLENLDAEAVGAPK